MSAFYVIFNRREQAGKQPGGAKSGNATVAPQKVSSAGLGGFTGQIEDACVVKLEGASLTTVAEAQTAAYSLFPTFITSTPVVVTEAAFKET